MHLMEYIAQRRTIVMDGAMGTELERRGVPVDTRAWSAMAMTDYPKVVRAVHSDFIDAGAELHIVNSFALARHVLEPAGLGEQVEEFNRLAVELCQQAIADRPTDRRHWIAGSLSTFAENSDRRKLPKGAVLRANYQEQADILAAAEVDLLALEMLCDRAITGEALRAATDTSLPIILGFTCVWGADGKSVETRSRESRLPPDDLEAVLAAVLSEAPADYPLILSIMHSDFDVTDAALQVLRQCWSGPIAVYPNSGGFENLHLIQDEVCPPQVFAEAALRWAGQGVEIVGGCCGLGPEHIRAFSDRL